MRMFFVFKQALRSANALNWIINTLLDNGFGSKETAPAIGMYSYVNMQYDNS